MQHKTDRETQTANPQATQTPSFWKSLAGIYLIVALVLAGLLLGYEHRVHIFASNWILWLPLLICVGMHFFMHGGHGGHGSGGKKS
ncbi:DUF2933 domain-containing protein [Primorskyibacter aestuariivivens]|uniref:DUF2933 domain-containing protein n=1 Tax=Primorskyibacter aestuariivivens TaxID=1888912 RepID=UPI00230052BB|nr:DUF2933 domain-containing protein [Primorskyibacter aestuariivivens]MDA7429209.1 DUF2933 domain-containing protein [Primorskyibacter aestuariivivens]